MCKEIVLNMVNGQAEYSVFLEQQGKNNKREGRCWEKRDASYQL